MSNILQVNFRLNLPGSLPTRSSVETIPLRNKISSRIASLRFAVAEQAINTSQWPDSTRGSSCTRHGHLHTAIRSSASDSDSTESPQKSTTRNSLSGWDSESETGACDSHRPPFDLNLAVLLAGFAFEVYNSPEVRTTSTLYSESEACVWHPGRLTQRLSKLPVG